MSKFVWAVVITALLALSDHVHAASCADVFPTGIASSLTTGSINLAGGAEVYNSPSNQLVTKNLNQNGATGCGSVVCVKTDTVASAAIDVTSYPSGASVYVGYQETRSFSPQSFSSLSSNSNAVLNFAPGDYTINSDMLLQGGTTINVSAPGTVRLFINGRFEIGNLGQLNMSGDATKTLYIYTRTSFTMQSDTKAKALVYAVGNVALNNNVALEGVITSAAAVTTQFGTAVTYNSNYIANADFGVSCESRFLKEYLIDVGTGAGSTCKPHAVTITAVDNRGNTFDIYDGTINLTTSLSNGTWSKTSNAADAVGLLSSTTNDSGGASYMFAKDDAGVVTLNLSNTHKETLTIKGVDSETAVSSTSAALAFSDNVFVVEPVDALGDDLIAGRSHNFRARMLKTDPVSGACAAAEGYSVAGVKAWLQRAAEDPGGAAPQLSAGNMLALPSTEPNSANATLNFNNGVAAFTLAASDVGKYTLQLKDAGLSYADIPIVGGSDPLVARPFALALSIPENPGSSSASGGVFRKAGELFTTNISGVAWQAEDDTNPLDGQADGHHNTVPEDDANLANNSVLASFGKENAPVNVQLGAALMLPVGGSDPALGGTSTISASLGSTQVAYDEVGIIQLNAAIAGSSYLGASSTRVAKIVGTSGYIGRFTPAQLNVSAARVDSGCTTSLDFTYWSQLFAADYTVTAVNTQGVTTTNYIGDFAKLQQLQLETSFTAQEEPTGTILDSRLFFDAANSYSWLAGVLQARTRLSVTRAGAPQASTNTLVGVALTDSDGVAQASTSFDLDSNGDGSMDALTLGSTLLRFGRLRLADSFGPETADLPVEFITEYWDGVDWRRNADDSCTAIAKADIGYPSGNLATAANGTVAIGGGTTTGRYANADASSVRFGAGGAGHFFSAPGQGNTGAFDVDVNVLAYPWLQFDWNGDGNHADAALPAATYTFGAYRGHDRVLYWLEVF